jgi:DNA helicase HerA-like ATPase
MNHPRDLDYIKKMIPNISADIVEKQKSLQPGTCMAFGKAFKVPMIVKMEMPNPEPSSSSCDIIATWGA